MISTTKWTVNAIKEQLRKAESHWFDPDTMECFGTEVMPTVFSGSGGIYFVTKDNQFRREWPKKFTVREFLSDKDDIKTAGELCGYDNQEDAEQAAMHYAADNGEFEARSESFKPVTYLEQFILILDKHSSDPSKVKTVDAKRMMTHAKRHHHLMELLCSDESFCKELDEEGEHPQIIDCRKRISQCAKRLGVKGVEFSGDPRGCTVKLVFADGYCNDHANEGYCVPILEDDE